MNPKQALDLLSLVTERLAPDLQVQMVTNDGQTVALSATSRSLHTAVADALRVLGEAIEPVATEEPTTD